MNSNHNYQPTHWNRCYENFNEALHEAHHERAFTNPSADFPIQTKKRKFSVKTKVFFALAAAILLSAPAWADESGLEQSAIALTTAGAAGLGCGVGGALIDYGSRGTAKPGTVLKGCAAGAVIVGGMTNITLEANSEAAWEQSELDKYDSEK